MKSWWHFYTTKVKYQNEKQKKSHLILQQKNKIPKNKFNQGGERYLYLEKYKPLKKEIMEDTIKWKHILYLWMEIINIIKMPYYPKQSINLIQVL